MIRQIIHPADEAHWLRERAQDLTSTDIPALFGLSPYKTKFELWHEKASAVRGEFVTNERMQWGNRLESAIAHTLADLNDWCVRPMKEYIRIPELRLGSSFDFRIMGSPEGRAAASPGIDSDDDTLLEIKNVDWLAFRQKWVVESDYIEAPAHIEIQAQHQMLVSGLRRAKIGVLVGGNDIRVIDREADEAVHDAIRREAAAFWQSIADNAPPPPVMPDDAGAVIRMHQYAAPGKLLDARGDDDLALLVRQWHAWKKEAKHAEEEATVCKAQLLERIGEAETVLLDGFKISASMVAPSAGTLVTPEMVGTYVGGRNGYRLVRETAVK